MLLADKYSFLACDVREIQDIINHPDILLIICRLVPITFSCEVVGTQVHIFHWAVFVILPSPNDVLQHGF